MEESNLTFSVDLGDLSNASRELLTFWKALNKFEESLSTPLRYSGSFLRGSYWYLKV